ncbi:(d)CMP kinase [Aureivirga sp. CE67]|uniref:(d)CMP kinase n=1 Tax=Aureivirga sp. CE67 TaxID=1788983 RepID=UPI0018C90697|nr:(d)CMP kinase [Aureivirga sp. CE67]
MESKKITIAIDGFSSTGKSTIAKELAKKLGYVYVDTGAMYRAVTYFAMINDYVSTESLNEEGLVKELANIKLKFVFNPEAGFSEMYLNGENIEKQIRGLEVSQLVSKVAAITDVRKVLVSQQQEMGKDKGVVMDGRDIGTVVFPDAELKLFMTASPDKRAKRRYKELLDKGENVKYEDVLKNVQTRDHIDTTRSDSPLKQAKDAIEFDNSDMGLKEQFERVYNITQRTIGEA